ncbi:MAG: PEP-CTERM sorting domain-containing protein [Akkermansia sp.]|nr:PEP-CTERM sorting domain-containing protein [Akkermansia sp.]
MKKTLSLLAIAVLAVGAALTTEAKDVVITADSSNVAGTAYGSLASGATLIDTATGGIIIYDESDDIDVIEAPFNLLEGTAATSLTVNLNDVAIQEGDRLVIDFTSIAYGYQTWGLYLQPNYVGSSGENYDYLRINITGFADWYQEYGPIEMAGRFKISSDNSYIETTAFYIAEACDFNDEGTPTSQGSLLFFSEDVIDDVVAAEVPPMVPEPTTATLSLLALAGLAARRRRK